MTDIAVVLQAQLVASFIAKEPITLPMPWDERLAAEEPIDPEVLDGVREHMKQYSAFSD